MEDNELKVGMLVYEAYAAQRPGIIREIGPHTFRVYHGSESGTMIDAVYDNVAKIEWVTGKTKQGETVSHLRAWELNLFEPLVESHRRKYEKQSKLVEQLREME